LGHPRAEWILLPRRAAAFWEGPERFKGRNRESRRREAAGRRNYPEAVPKERSGRKETTNIKSLRTSENFAMSASRKAMA